jgi:hypothetical protein
MAFAASIPGDPDNDSLVDTPSNASEPTDTGAGGEVVGNYATFNPLDKTSGITLSDGNLKATGQANGSDRVRGTIAIPRSGKWYFEFTLGSAFYGYIGISNIDGTKLVGRNEDGRKYTEAGHVSTPFASITAGDVVGVALDNNTTLTFYKNGVAESTTVTVDSNTDYFAMANFYNAIYILNSGQRAFGYTAPSGYKALNTSSLPTPTIADGSKYFDTKLYSGDGTNGRAITGLNYSPDLVWIKARNQIDGHNLFDIVRGTTKVIKSNNTNAELTESNSLTAFNSDGFTVGSNASNAQVNASGFTYAAWAWDGGSSNTTIAVGGLNSSAYVQSQTWSSNITTTGNSGNWWPTYPATHVFDADTSNYGHPNGNGNPCVVTLTLSPAITCNSSVTYFGGLDTGAVGVTIAINGGTAVSCTAGYASTTRTTVPFSGSISTITLTKSASGGGLLVYGFEIDGKRLVDSGVSVPNIPSIASTVRANPSAGFSIVKYSAASNPVIGHGLNAVPEFVIVKCTNVSSHWTIFHKDLGVDKELRFTSAAASTVSGIWGTDSMWTSNTFGVYQTINQLDNNYGDMVAYCFSSVEGYSSVGSYVGNGSADGVFIYTGFTPSWLLFKRHDAGSDWTIYDTKRDPHNVAGDKLEPNTSDAESAEGAVVDILSNGFKFRRGSLENGGNDAYVYVAFASKPFANNGGLAR